MKPNFRLLLTTAVALGVVLFALSGQAWSGPPPISAQLADASSSAGNSLFLPLGGPGRNSSSSSAGLLMAFPQEIVPGFHAPVTMPGSTGTGASEPSLAIGNTGLRYVSWQVPGEFAKSPDGVNFNKITTPDTGAGGDVTNAIGSNGAIYNGQICGGATELHTCIYRSTDGGTTWQQRNMLADMHPGAADRPWITVRPGASPDQDTVYLEFHTFTPDDLVYVTKSTDGGLNFGPAIPVETGTNSAIPDSSCNTIPGGIIVDQTNGNVYALWLSGDDVAQNVVTGCNYSQIGPFTKAWVSKSTDGGTTWTPALAYQGVYDPLTNIGDNAGKIFSTITQDTSGQVQIGLSVRHNDDPRGFVEACQLDPNCLESPNPTDMYIVTSPDQGAHWTLPFKVNQTTGSFFFPWIHAGSAGRIDVANYNSTTLRPNDKTSIWYVGMSQVTGAVASYVSGPNATYNTTPVSTPQILLDPDRVHGNGTTGGGICTYGLFCAAVPGSNRSLADVFEVHLDPAGGANVTWTSDNGGAHIGFACQNSGASALYGAPNLNGCYGPADLSITKTDSQDPVSPGGTLTYHLTITNNGTPAMPATTSGVTITDVLPAGVTLVSATPSTGTCSGTSTVTCDLGIFPSAATATIDIVVQVAAGASGTLTNTATVTALTNDPSPGNNTATAVTTVGSLCVPVNVALTSNGSSAVASSSHISGNFPALSAINGDRTGASWGTSTGGWNDNTRNSYPDIFEVDFPVTESIGQINVFTLQNNWTTAGQPTLASPATGEGILDFIVQYCSSSCGTATPTWTTVSGGDVTGNDKAWRAFTFPAASTSKIRVVVNNSRNNWSRIVEVEALRSCPP